MTEGRSYDSGARRQAQAQTRLRITEAAVALHRSVGPARTSVAEIARRAGVDRVTVYRHFPDDGALFAACAAHFAALNPPPDPAGWAGVADARQRLERALTALYAYYERVEDMLANVTRDAETMPQVRAAGAGRREWLAAVERGLARDWRRPAEDMRHPVALAIDFRTWQTLVRRRGLPVSDAIALVVAMVVGADAA